MTADIEFSRIISVNDVIVGDPLKKVIGAKKEECEALAKRYGILAVTSLKASLKVEKIKASDVYKVSGHFNAGVEQECVVSLAPVPDSLSGNIEAYFTDQKQPSTIVQETEMPDESEDPEFAENGEIDLGELVAQMIALELNPYPRAEGVEFDEAKHTSKKPNPFAALKVLKGDSE